MGERRRAERLFHAAKLHVPFTPPPGLADVARHDEATIRGELTAAMDGAISDAATRIARELIAGGDAEPLVAALVDRALRERPAGERVTPVEIKSARPMTPRAPSGDYVLFEINLGAKDRAEAGWILPLLCRRGGITRREVGAIRVSRDRTYFEIRSNAAEAFAADAAERDPRAPHVRIERAKEAMPERSFTPPKKHGVGAKIPHGAKRPHGPPKRPHGPPKRPHGPPKRPR
jgi:ATP-dependent RNA helicase DeaD